MAHLNVLSPAFVVLPSISHSLGHWQANANINAFKYTGKTTSTLWPSTPQAQDKNSTTRRIQPEDTSPLNNAAPLHHHAPTQSSFNPAPRSWPPLPRPRRRPGLDVFPFLVVVPLHGKNKTTRKKKCGPHHKQQQQYHHSSKHPHCWQRRPGVRPGRILAVAFGTATDLRGAGQRRHAAALSSPSPKCARAQAQ